MGLIIFGADWFIKAAVAISEKLNIPQIIIGSTIVSILTSSPELVASATATYHGHIGIAIGNAIGSVICNMALILATAIILRPILITNTKSFVNATLFMLAAGIIAIGLSIDGTFTGFDGAITCLLFIGFLYYNYRLQVSNFKENEKSSSTKNRFQGISKDIALFFIGAGAVIIGSKTLVSSAVIFAEWLGIPELIIGLTIVAIGTSLPEYVTAITAVIKKHPDLTLGNILGANVANLTYIIGVSSLIHPLTISAQMFEYDFIIMIGIMVLILIFGTTGNIFKKKEGLVMLSIYIAYVIGLVVLFG